MINRKQVKVLCLLLATIAFSQTTNKQEPVCGANEPPFRDFDFLLGTWDFFLPDGRKIGEHTYTKREQGCLILEEWKTVTGSTGTGMNFVDPKTGKWRQVWMSPLFHIDYSGSLTEEGNMILEGTIYPNNGGDSSPVRGVWTPQDDGSVKQEFIKFNSKSAKWETFFLGFSRRKTN